MPRWEPRNTEPGPLPDDLAPLDPAKFGPAEARHLLLRAGFGGTPEQCDLLASWGLEKAVEHLVEFESVPAEADSPDLFDKDIMRPPSEEERREARQAAIRRDEDFLAAVRARRQQAETLDRQQMRRVQEWWLTRMIQTPRPLEEKLTLFWHGHFATSYRTIENSYHMYQQNRFFRAHAAGNFGDLLFGIIRDPAMLAYLDNNDSRKDEPNENLARELMELFSLGVGNYTETDIKEGARTLTGYTFEDDEFVFNRRNHDQGTKQLLGVRGNLDGDGFVRAILARPACSRFLAAKLYDFFVRHTDPAGDATTRKVVERMARELLRGRYALKPMLTRLFSSAHFYHPRVVNERIKSPAELIVGTMRTLGTPARDLGVLNDAMDLMGQRLFFPPSVKGWDGGRAWINTSTLFVRQNAAAFLLTGKSPAGTDALAADQRFDPAPVARAAAGVERLSRDNAGEVVDGLCGFCLGRPSAAARATLTDFLAANASASQSDTLLGGLLLLTAMPEYQLC